jgi:hypothetical protein
MYTLNECNIINRVSIPNSDCTFILLSFYYSFFLLFGCLVLSFCHFLLFGVIPLNDEEIGVGIKVGVESDVEVGVESVIEIEVESGAELETESTGVNGFIFLPKSISIAT